MTKLYTKGRAIHVTSYEAALCMGQRLFYQDFYIQTTSEPSASFILCGEQEIKLAIQV